MAGGYNRIPHDFVMVFGVFNAHAEYLVELRSGDNDRGGIGEADDHRVRQEIHHHAEPQQPQAELKQADEQR